MTDSQIMVFAVAVALIGAVLAGTALRDHQHADSIGARNHTGVEPSDVFGFRDRQDSPGGYVRREWHEGRR